MDCNIGLFSEFIRRYPRAILSTNGNPINQWFTVMGVANRELDEMWIFIDKIALSGMPLNYIPEFISISTVHEITHLFGVKTEREAKNGEELVNLNDRYYD